MPSEFAVEVIIKIHCHETGHNPNQMIERYWGDKITDKDFEQAITRRADILDAQLAPIREALGALKGNPRSWELLECYSPGLLPPIDSALARLEVKE